MTATLLAAGHAAAQDDDDGDKLYKWVDEDGNVTYQDQPPPDESGQVQTFGEPAGESEDAAAAGTTLPDVDITLYSIEVCNACDLVRELLDERGLPFTEKDAEHSVAVQDELREVSGVLSVPVLAIGDEVLSGFNRELILRVLRDAGFPTTPAAQAEAQSGGQSPEPGQLTPEELEQAARDAVQDDDLQEEDIFSDLEGGPSGDDISQWEEIPEDEQIRVGE